MRILLIAFLLLGVSGLEAQKLKRMKNSVKNRSKVKSKPSRSSSSTSATRSSRSSSSSQSSRSLSTTRPIKVQPSTSNTSTTQSSNRGKLSRLKNSVKNRKKNRKRYVPSGSGSSGGHTYTYYNPIYMPAGYFFYHDMYRRYPYYYYGQNNFMMDHYYGYGNSYYYDNNHNNYNDNQHEEKEYFDEDEQQLYSDYPYSDGQYFKRFNGETRMLNASYSKGYDSDDAMHLENVNFFLAFEQFSINANYVELKNTYQDTTSYYRYYNLGVGYYKTFPEYDASFNIYIATASMDVGDQFFSESFDGWSYGFDIKTFFPSKVSMNLRYTYYGLSEDFDSFTTFYYSAKMLNVNLAYHIHKFELILGLNRQSLSHDYGDEILNFSFKQPYLGIGVYL